MANLCNDMNNCGGFLSLTPSSRPQPRSSPPPPPPTLHPAASCHRNAFATQLGTTLIWNKCKGWKVAFLRINVFTFTLTWKRVNVCWCSHVILTQVKVWPSGSFRALSPPPGPGGCRPGACSADNRAANRTSWKFSQYSEKAPTTYQLPCYSTTYHLSFYLPVQNSK